MSHSTNCGGNGTIVFGETVVYTCDGGYCVNFTKSQSQLESKCSKDGEFTTLSERLPADCGTRGDAHQ